MKKSYIVFLFALGMTTAMTAQNRQTKKADKLYERLEYADAAEAYEKLVKKGKADDYVYTQLGNTYYYMNDSKEAAKYYEKVLPTSEDANAEEVIRYAQVLKRNGKVSEYNQWMKNFARMNPNDSRAKAFMDEPNYLEDLLNSEPGYTAENLDGVNSDYSDFGGFIHGDDFYFATARNTKRKTYGWNDQPYLDIYKAKLVGDNIQDAEAIKGDVNTKYHESSVSISPDGKRMYFDRNDYFRGKYKKGDDGVNRIHIYYAENVDGDWKDVQEVPFNNRDFSTGHPAVSPDGEWLYFSSERPESLGTSDIYRVAIKEDGFGEPQRLPNHINTEGKEVFPFVDNEGTLYFSSDGHPGMGGLDVFYAEAKGNSFGEVKNMGPAVNSSADDFAFHYNTEDKKGFVSSDRASSSVDNIYSIKPIEICETVLAVNVKDSKTNEALTNAKVNLYDENNNLVATEKADAEGYVAFDADCELEYFIAASIDDYEDNSIAYAPTKEDLVEQDLLLDRIIVEDKIVINMIHFDFDKSEIKPEAALELDRVVAVMKKHSNMVIKVEAHSDSQGNSKYNLGLSDRRAQSTVQYIVSQGIDASRVSGEGFGDTKPEIECGANCTKEEHATNRRSDFIIVKK